MIARLVLQLFVLIMTAITLLVTVIVMLGIGWLAVAIPTLVLIALISAGIALWRRWAAFRARRGW